MFSHYILSNYSHAYTMFNVLNDVEWRTYTQWMTNLFRRGTISERWIRIEQDRCLILTFQNIINTEIMGASGIRT